MGVAPPTLGSLLACADPQAEAPQRHLWLIDLLG